MNYLFSIHPQYAEKIFDGTKTVELRNRRVQLTHPARLWIYVTTPEKHLAGFATVRHVDFGNSTKIWKRYWGELGITQEQYFAYVGDRELVSAIVVEDVVRFETPLGLSRLKQLLPTFHPPQFYMDMSAKKGFAGLVAEELGYSCPAILRGRGGQSCCNARRSDW